jgi:hypothetical protein
VKKPTHGEDSEELTLPLVDTEGGLVWLVGHRRLIRMMWGIRGAMVREDLGVKEVRADLEHGLSADGKTGGKCWV